MKSFKNLFNLLLIATLIFTSCTNDDDVLDKQLSLNPKNISEILSETTDLSTLAGAIETASLTETLKSTTTYTVFAPNNVAFSSIDTSALSSEELTNVLLNHVLSTTTPDFTSTMVSGYLKTLATGPDGNNLSIFTNASGDIAINGMANLVDGATDMGATNGIVHVVDNVLLLPTLADHVLANPEYSILAEALEKADLVDTLNGTDLFTVFAPNNMAFEKFMMDVEAAFGWTSLDDIPVDILTEVLLYHVLSGSNLVSSDALGTAQTTVQGEGFSINDDASIDDTSYTNATINLTDVQSINGVMHGVDKVLLPNTVFQEILDRTLNVVERCNDKGFTSFTAAIEKVGLTSQVSTDQLTAFAPNNGAFTTFFLTINNFDSLDDFDTPEELEILKRLVEYHLHAGTLLASGLTPGMSIETLQGDSFTFDDVAMSFEPSHANAPAATIVNSNIGANNGVIHEIDNVLVSDNDAVALGYPLPPSGAAVYGYEIYDDALNPAFWIGGWTAPDFASTDQVKSGVYSIRVDYVGDDGFQIGGSGEDLTQYTTVNAAFYSENGTSVTFILNEQWGSGQTVSIPAGEWTNVSIPITNISNGTTVLDQFVIRDASLSANTLYIDEVGLDVTYEAAIPTFNYEVYTENNLNADWIGGWTTPVFDDTSNPSTGIFSIRNVMVADSGFQLGGTNIDLTAYTVVKFSIYCDDTTTFKLVLNEQWDGYVINPTAGQWNHYTVPLADALYGTTSYTQFVIQEIGGNDVVAFIDDIGFD
ncbi:fasciclin domain-containing protein [Flavivirga abyssicola]|uniref:fasciclin domain-containing protein n=1 Tax=Flavivirga abyssicola TaxID=3063533 RepID=UPI0026DF2D1F|nr:fasciclin domain-containing protein [Flavivirga sp. MEBiC07777]WVK12590.1 fasciclin domain-containing protein [Flavivirga sp. MEBiC07777]